MEPPIINNDSTFSSSYSFSEIWPMPPPQPSSLHPHASADNSAVTAGHPPNHRKRKDATPDHLNDSGNKHIKVGEANASSAASNKLLDEQSAKPSEPPKQDYIHVRARRGQATDSHSLAERARREKISERMKILQDLVPGCNKVIGKALVLDEIINYIQSLQQQVEFLSMKLEAVNSRLDMTTIECFPPKDVGTQSLDLAGMIFASQATREYAQGSQPGWLHMQIGGGFERAT